MTRPRRPHPAQMSLGLDRVLAVVQTSTGRPLFILAGGLTAPSPEPVARKARAAA